MRSGKLHIHQLGNALSQDVTGGKQTLGSCKHGDLLLRDRGYFDLKSFKLLSQDDQADYVSRLEPKTSIYESDGERLDLARLAQQMKKAHIPFVDKRVIIGIKGKTQVRVIITLPPDEVVRLSLFSIILQAFPENTNKLAILTSRKSIVFNIFLLIINLLKTLSGTT